MRKSPAVLRRAENDWRIAEAVKYVGPIYRTLGTDGSVVARKRFPHRTRGAGAAVLVDHNNQTVFSATKRASEGCCSYSTECRGGECGLGEIAGIQNDDTPVIWVTDSRSLIQALEKGCLLQTEHAEAHLWHSLLKLAERGIKIAVVWVFSHCGGCTVNDMADELAGKEVELIAAETQTLTEPWWHVDAARARYSVVRDKYNDRLDAIRENWPEERKKADSNLRTLEPLRLSTTAHIAPRLQKVLSALRSGVWHPLGISETAPVTCICGTKMTRAYGVSHLFTCPHPEAVRLRPRFASLDALWSSRPSRLQAIGIYALEFKRLLSSRLEQPSAGVVASTLGA